jgi:uncharacterized lipoprotein YmbA
MIRHGMLLGLALGAAGCLSLKPQPDPARFYVLSATVPEPASRQPGLVVGVGPVTLPDYLDRSQLVTRYGDHRLGLAEASRWAEPLEPMVARVLRDDLVAALGAERGLDHPWARTLAPAPVIEVDVERFERDSAGTARLDARWRVRHGDRSRVGRAQLTEPSATPGSDDAVAALSRVLGRLAQDIAAAARELATTP